MSKSAQEIIRGLNLSPDAEENPAMPKLREIRDALGELLGKSGGGMAVRLSPGFQVNLGLEQRMIVEVPARNYRETLFRAYVPATGFPIRFDFYGEELTECRDAAEADVAVAAFFERPEVVSRLRQFVELAKAAA